MAKSDLQETGPQQIGNIWQQGPRHMHGLSCPDSGMETFKPGSPSSRRGNQDQEVEAMDFCPLNKRPSEREVAVTFLYFMKSCRDINTTSIFKDEENWGSGE